MKSLGYGEIRNGRVVVSRFGDGASLEDGARFDGLLMGRTDFQVRIVDIPPVADRDVAALIGYRLRSLYPGHPAETAFDFVLETAGKQRRAVVFIARGEVLSRYRDAAGPRPLLLPYSLIRRLARKRRDLCVLFAFRDRVEMTVFRGGLPVSCIVRPWDGTPDFTAMTDGQEALPILVVAAGADGVPPGMEFRDLRELAAGRHGGGLFGAPRRGPPLPARGIRIAVLACAVAALSALLFFRHVGAVEAERDALQVRYAALEREIGGALARQKETEGLEAEIRRIGARKPRDIYRFLSGVASVLDGGAVIGGLTVRDNGFQIDAVGANPLRLMERFGGHGGFRDVRLSQVVPDARSDRERFSFSGVFDAR